MNGFEEMRKRMVENQLRHRGVKDARVLSAMASVPREVFVPDIHRARAYTDQPLPIGEGQTISQPYIVALMIEALALAGDEKALDIGSGSGYAAAILARCCKKVFAVERIGALAARSIEALRLAGAANVRVRVGDGARGWAEEAPFDAILVSAGAAAIPEMLKAQLAPGGRMVIPVGGDALAQNLVRVTRKGEAEFTQEVIADVRFVPLISARAKP